MQRSFVSEISKYYCIAITYFRKKFSGINFFHPKEVGAFSLISL
ncbi:hypothetical protein [Psychrobacillus psychrotolerans]|nr:hypothetical protein [Psychrobacillus psychrotolerans]